MNSRCGIGARLLGGGWHSPRPARRRPKRLLIPPSWVLAIWIAAATSFVPASPQAFAADAGAANAAPAVEEWLNQPVHLRATVQAMSRPSPDAQPAGEIRAGAEVKAIGLVAGKHWVEIELPDHSQAYVPREAVAYETNSSEPPVGQQASPAAAAPAAVPASTAASAVPPGPAAASSPPVAPASVAGQIRGKVARVPNAATLVVGDQRIRLSGIDPGPAEFLGPFESWVRNQGDLVCDPDAQTGRYHCFTGSGVDVAQAAILNGTGRVGDGASPEYRDSETQARDAKRGLWAQP
jgi:endonuclease YncB( thermonuclease family)